MPLRMLPEADWHTWREGLSGTVGTSKRDLRTSILKDQGATLIPKPLPRTAVE
jgi:hypothetical protein